MIDAEKQTWTTGDDEVYEDLTPEHRHNLFVAVLLRSLRSTHEYEARAMYEAQIMKATNGEGPTAEQERLSLAMDHEEEHHDSGPDIPG